jgi:uroporphyrinogen-III synthase
VTESPLNGFGVLVTRPTSQAPELIEAIQDNGGTAVHFPAIEIVPRAHAAVAEAAAALPQADIAIFVSRNAVQFGLTFAEGAAIAAIGPATAAAVAANDRLVDIDPENGFDSESLLQHSVFNDVHGKAVRIIRGGDGRELLAETLRDRGATVNYLSVYDRECPVVRSESLAELETAWRDGQIDAVTVMSVASFVNLVDLLPKWCESQLKSVALVAPAVRVIKEIQNRYPNAKPILAAGPQTADMLQAIISIQKTRPGQAT